MHTGQISSICLSSAAMASSSMRRCAGRTARLRSCCVRVLVSFKALRRCSLILASGVIGGFGGVERRCASSCWASTNFESNPRAIVGFQRPVSSFQFTVLLAFSLFPSAFSLSTLRDTGNL
jgi:hypothetical protein